MAESSRPGIEWVLPGEYGKTEQKDMRSLGITGGGERRVVAEGREVEGS